MNNRLMNWFEHGTKSECEHSLDYLEAKDKLIDEETLQKLARDTSPVAVPTMVDVFLQETTNRLQRIGDFQEVEDWERLSDESHALKSTSATFGAARLQHLAEELEEACDAQEREKISRLLAKLPDLFGQSRAALLQHCKLIAS